MGKQTERQLHIGTQRQKAGKQKDKNTERQKHRKTKTQKSGIQEDRK